MKEFIVPMTIKRIVVEKIMWFDSMYAYQYERRDCYSKCKMKEKVGENPPSISSVFFNTCSYLSYKKLKGRDNMHKLFKAKKKAPKLKMFLRQAVMINGNDGSWMEGFIQSIYDQYFVVATEDGGVFRYPVTGSPLVTLLTENGTPVLANQTVIEKHHHHRFLEEIDREIIEVKEINVLMKAREKSFSFPEVYELNNEDEEFDCCSAPGYEACCEACCSNTHEDINPNEAVSDDTYPTRA